MTQVSTSGSITGRAAVAAVIATALAVIGAVTGIASISGNANTGVITTALIANWSQAFFSYKALEPIGSSPAAVNINGVPLTTTIGVLSNGLTLPQAVINVASTTNFPTASTLTIGNDIVMCTGVLAGTQFTGCTGGTGVLSTGETVASGVDCTKIPGDCFGVEQSPYSAGGTCGSTFGSTGPTGFVAEANSTTSNDIVIIDDYGTTRITVTSNGQSIASPTSGIINVVDTTWAFATSTTTLDVTANDGHVARFSCSGKSNTTFTGCACTSGCSSTFVTNGHVEDDSFTPQNLKSCGNGFQVKADGADTARNGITGSCKPGSPAEVQGYCDSTSDANGNGMFGGKQTQTSGSFSLPASTITVASTTGFPTGTINIWMLSSTSATVPQKVTCTGGGGGGTSFTGCSGGTGTVASSAWVLSQRTFYMRMVAWAVNAPTLGSFNSWHVHRGLNFSTACTQSKATEVEQIFGSDNSFITYFEGRTCGTPICPNNGLSGSSYTSGVNIDRTGHLIIYQVDINATTAACSPSPDDKATTVTCAAGLKEQLTMRMDQADESGAATKATVIVEGWGDGTTGNHIPNRGFNSIATAGTHEGRYSGIRWGPTYASVKDCTQIP